MEAKRESLFLHPFEQERWSVDVVLASFLVLDILEVAFLCEGHQSG